MNEITRIAQGIQAKRQELAGIGSELERCAACIAATAETRDTLASLKRQRKDALTASFMAGKEADTSEVDKMIKAAEKAATEATDTAAGAEGAQEVLQVRLATAEEELGQLIREQHDAAYGVIEQEFRTAEIEYTQAAQKLHSAIVKMMACNAAGMRFKRFQAGGSSLREIMKGYYTDGLSVNRGRHLPESFGLRFLTLAEEEAAPEAQRLIAKLQAAGLEIEG